MSATIRQTIDHRAERVPIDDQCGEMLAIVVETEFDLQRRVQTGQLSAMEATARRRNRHGILATLKWVQEHRETIVSAHKMLAQAREKYDDSSALAGAEGLTEDEDTLISPEWS